MSYTLDTEDDSLIETICSHVTIALLIKALLDPNDSIQAPALKAVANLLTVDNENIVDIAISQKLIDNLFTLSQQPNISNHSDSLQEICYSLSNIACGT